MVARIVRFSIGAWIALALGYAAAGKWWGLVGLTCSGGVVIINFLWLERIVVRVLQPAPRVEAWRLGVRALARMALFGVALAVSIFVVRFNPLSVLLGFSILVIGIGCEVLYAVYRASGETV
ncbi:MAG TPA: ATP synthase subunit I [Thermoanaerobaculia bacterium]|nr:ATP synthase subunit I [Thermoanaerobaculia bacterium]